MGCRPWPVVYSGTLSARIAAIASEAFYLKENDTMGGLCWRGLQRQVTPDAPPAPMRLWEDSPVLMEAYPSASRNPPEPTTPRAMLRRLRSPEFGLGGP